MDLAPITVADRRTSDGTILEFHLESLISLDIGTMRIRIAQSQLKDDENLKHMFDSIRNFINVHELSFSIGYWFSGVPFI